MFYIQTLPAIFGTKIDMNIFGLNKVDNATDIYFYRPSLPSIDTRKKFDITIEDGKLRVKNKTVNCLFSNLTPDYFDELYNDFNRHLNLDFEPATIDGNEFRLDKDEREKLIEAIITNWIYYYTINNLQVKVKRGDFTHPYMVDWLLTIVDKKYGLDTKESLTLGAKILRQSLTTYTRTVRGQRQYYDR
jgi:hypothetical protein